jgi:hypothetical protein
MEGSRDHCARSNPVWLDAHRGTGRCCAMGTSWICIMSTCALLAGIAALFLATGAAHAVEIPKQYRGVWCGTKWETIHERCPPSDYAIEINRTNWTREQSTCTLSAIHKSKYGGHRLLGKCRPTDSEPSRMDDEVEEHWWLGSNNTRLQIIIRDFCSTIGKGKCE